MLTNYQCLCLVTVMKQVARKSTTSVPRKFSDESHQQNGLVPIRESADENNSTNVSSDTSTGSSKDASADIGLSKISNTNCGDQHKSVHLTNGLHDSCEQALGNRAGCSAAVTVQQQTVENSTCTVTSASVLHVSAANVPLPSQLHTSSNIGNSKSVKDASAETTKLSSVATSSHPSDDVIFVKADAESKPDVHSVKRPVSPADEKKAAVKQPKLDGAVGQLVNVDGNDRLTRKVHITCSFT